MKKLMVLIIVLNLTLLAFAIPLRDEVYDIYGDDIKFTVQFHDNGLFKWVGDSWVRCGGWDIRYNQNNEIEVFFTIHDQRYSGKLDSFGIIKGIMLKDQTAKAFMGIKNYEDNF